jgi:hypothetical protein
MKIYSFPGLWKIAPIQHQSLKTIQAKKVTPSEKLKIIVAEVMKVFPVSEENYKCNIETYI